MMESIVGNVWSPRRLSRTKWAVLNRAREEIQALPLFHSPPPSWHNAVDRLEESILVTNLFHDLLTEIHAATDGYCHSLGAADEDGELVERVLWALVLTQSERMIGMHEMCFLCASDEMVRNEPWMKHSPRVSMERRLVSSCGNWTLHEISIFPSLGDGDDQGPLCWSHELEFRLAPEALLGFLDPSVRTLEHRHSSCLIAME